MSEQRKNTGEYCRARQRLFCSETMSGIDDIIQISPNSSTNHCQEIPLESINVTQFRSDFLTPTQTNIIVNNNHLLSHELKSRKEKDSQNMLQINDHDPPKSITTSQRNGIFIKGLYNEIKKQPASCSITEGTSMVVANNENEQEVPDITLDQGASSSDINIDDDEEVLVLYDDFMTSSGVDSDSGSDIDWSSLTPPAPRSPNDQRVPEMEDGTIKGISMVESFHMQSSPTIDSYFGFSTSNIESSLVDLHRLPATSSDHVVPEFFG